MTKILMMGTRKDETLFANQWAKDHDVSLTTSTEFLNNETYHLLKGFDGLCLQQTMGLPDDMYARLKKDGFTQIAQRSAGVDMYHLEEAKRQGIKITNIPAYSPNSVAEFVVSSALNAIRHTHAIQNRVSKHDFSWDQSILSREIRSLTIGILGTGKIGQIAAQIFKGFGATVIGYDLYQNKSAKNFLTYKDDFDDFLKKSDIITIHMPLTPENYHQFNEEALKKMKPGAILINAARGGIVDTKALLKMVDSGHLSYCVLDTYENEMPFVTKDWTEKSLEDPVLEALLEHENIQYTPHIAFYTDMAIENLVCGGLQACLDILKTGDSAYVVNR
ncbi:D-2-hydroxyacid dehydrogenase [Listeria ilorinensis]|uniref:D-2-hydroxyacid dehydrogenase n=1 Tax=Listeria ilorinensis TaxID=2867439 RepID=UPI001EF6B4B0|nr:D-2-hydroxyacid dehydrogenase [Listeria ilorinensis]